MNKPDFIKKIAEKYNISQRAAGEIVERYTETMKECLIIGESVSIMGLYKISVRDKKEREGINPSTLEPMIIPAMKTLHCKFSEGLKKEINGF